jgi:CheY-like chemotaxis protein
MSKVITRRPHGRLSQPSPAPRSATLEQRVLGAVLSPGFDPPDTAGERPAKPVRVLVVDDCPFQRLLSCTLLSQWGIHPELACDGLEALLLVGEQDFDMVLMDLRMPVMDGLTATARIRAVEQAQRRPRPVPVIAYTAEPIAGHEGAWSRIGITAALAKPSDPFEMGACLGRWCGINVQARQH